MSQWKLPPVIYETDPSSVRPSQDRWSYGPELMKLDPVLEAAAGEGVVVCVLDTAASWNHRDLPAPVDSKIFTGESSGADGNGHSTHCAGIVHEYAPMADLAAYKVLSNSGSGSTTGIANAIRHVIKKWTEDWRGKKYTHCIISMSLGGGYSSDIDNAMRDAASVGIIIVCAAGNSGSGGVDHPGSSRYSYATVAAINRNKQITSFSSRGPEVTVCAPGEGINSTWPGNQFRVLSGTSMATPAIAAIAALICSSMPSRTDLGDLRVFQSFIHSNCEDLGTSGRDNAYGFGLPILNKLVSFVLRFF